MLIVNYPWLQIRSFGISSVAVDSTKPSPTTIHTTTAASTKPSPTTIHTTVATSTKPSPTTIHTTTAASTKPSPTAIHGAEPHYHPIYRYCKYITLCF
jgi:hypothetical protein